MQQLPFRYRIAVMCLLISIKKSFSTEEIHRQLGYKRYQPGWKMACMIRDVVGKCDAQYTWTDRLSLMMTSLPRNVLISIRLHLWKGDVAVRRSLKWWSWWIPTQGHSWKGKPYKNDRTSEDAGYSRPEEPTVTDVAKKHFELSVELTTDDSISYYKFGV